MSAQPRLDRLYPALSAHERAMLALEACKSEAQPPIVIYTTMPPGQAREFNRKMAIINAINVELAAVTFGLREQVRQIDLRYGWMMTLLMLGLEVEKLAGDVRAATKDRKD